MKGGCGKTMSAVNVAAFLSTFGRSVLLIDCDYQCNATYYLGQMKAALLGRRSIYEALIGEKTLEDVIISTDYPNLDMIPATTELAQFNDQPRDRYTLRGLIARSKKAQAYDYIIIDSRPELSELLRNVGMACSQVIIPMFAEADSISGLGLLLKHLKSWSDAKKDICAESIEIMGCVISNYNKKISTHRNIVPLLEKMLEEKSIPLLATIPHSTGAAASVEAATPLPFYTRLKAQGINEAIEGLTREIEKKSKKSGGRPRKIPTLTKQEIQDANQAIFQAIESDEAVL